MSKRNRCFEDHLGPHHQGCDDTNIPDDEDWDGSQNICFFYTSDVADCPRRHYWTFLCLTALWAHFVCPSDWPFRRESATISWWPYERTTFCHTITQEWLIIYSWILIRMLCH
jgi:hypothetical protein